MKYEFSLALAFIKSGRKKWRVNFHTFLSILGITVGVAFLIFALSIYDGYVKKIETIIFSFYPQIMLRQPVTAKDDDDDEEIIFEEETDDSDQKICSGVRILEDNTLSSSKSSEKQMFDLNKFQDLKRRLESIGDVVQVSPIIFEGGNFTFTYFRGNKEITEEGPLRFLGVQPRESRFVPEIERTITDPGLLEKLASPGNHYVILSAELHKKLFGAVPSPGSTVNKKIHLRTKTGESDQTLDLTAAGVFKLGMHNVSKNMIITSLSTAQEIFSMKGKASFLGVSLKKPYEAGRISSLVKEELARDNLMVFQWLALASDMFNSLSFYRKIIFILLFMSILITSFNIYNTLNIMILERKRQIGILVSMGVKKKSLYRVFFFISQIEALAGVVFGLMVGTAMGYFFSDYLNEALAEFLPVQDASIALHWGTVILVTFFVCLLSGITAFLATRKGANLDPVEALSSE